MTGEEVVRSRRGRRRVTAPATDGIPESERTQDGTVSDPDPESGEGSGSGGPAGHGSGASTRSDQWWQEQRPPHWE